MSLKCLEEDNDVCAHIIGQHCGAVALKFGTTRRLSAAVCNKNGMPYLIGFACLFCGRCCFNLQMLWMRC